MFFNRLIVAVLAATIAAVITACYMLVNDAMAVEQGKWIINFTFMGGLVVGNTIANPLLRKDLSIVDGFAIGVISSVLVGLMFLLIGPK